MLKTRAELPKDILAIQEVNVKAFGQPDEGNIVGQLRKDCDQLISLVAEKGSQLIGHILFTPITTELSEPCIQGMGLAPMAVLPDFQKQGVGAALIKEGIKRLKQIDCDFVVVLGHPEYYPKFGFKPAIEYGIKCEWDVPDGAFMALELNPDALRNVSGLVKYRPEFSQVV